MTKKYQIDDIDIPSPCSEPWENMKGSAEKRFCGSCEKHVYNLTGMPRRKADLLLRKSGGKICVRFARTRDGAVITADQPALFQITRRAGIVAGVIATSMSLSSFTYAQGAPRLSSKSKPTSIEQNIGDIDESKTLETVETSQISVAVLDQTGAVIPGALVSFVHEGTKNSRSTYTGPDGVAHLGTLRKGRFKVTVESDGFRPYSRYKRLALAIEPNLEVTLDAGFLTGVIVDDSYEIPVFEAIAKDRIDELEVALRNGFDIKTEGAGKRTALHVAVDHLRVRAVEILIAEGANVDAKTEDGDTAIVSLSEDFGEEEADAINILRMLIESGADINIQNDLKETALMNASYYDDAEAVEILLSAGAVTSFKDEDGETAYEKTTDDEVKEIFQRYGIFN